MLRLQLALLRSEPGFTRLREQVQGIASALEEKASIPMVLEHIELIQELQIDTWWQDVTGAMLEVVRKRLRGLVRLIEKQRRKPLYVNFEEQVGTITMVMVPGFTPPDAFGRFRAKARAFLLAHQDHLTVHKVRMNEPLTPSDLAELERMLAESKAGGTDELHRAMEETHGLGLVVRSLVGLDREAAKRALASFLSGKTLGANQIEFVSLIVDHLTEHGVMDTALLYESPFTDISPQGPEGVFSEPQVGELISLLDQIRAKATAA